MKQHQEWVRFPSRWIQHDRMLRAFDWTSGGSTNTAGLMLLIALAHQAAPEPDDERGLDTGETDASYSVLRQATGLSRAKIASGLALTEQHGLVMRRRDGRRSIYAFPGYDPVDGWAKLPARALYSRDQSRILAFEHFTLRNRLEHDALKLYLLLVAFRDRRYNVATIRHDKMVEYASVRRDRIRDAIGFLLLHRFVIPEMVPRQGDEDGIQVRYRIVGVSPRRHAGTTGRHELAESASVPF